MKPKIFEKAAVAKIFQKSGGIPRRINQLCDMALFIGSSAKAKAVSASLIEEASRSLEGV
ncbi:MAG: hypothetical protein HY466_02715 [Deltaproteobacteria bacterium]|nr:hypothetical protein [Deltaproteobacteria bacterium]